MYRCADCKSAFVSPQPTLEFLADFYARFHLVKADGGYYEDFEIRAAQDFDAKVDNVIKVLPASGVARVLDVGCGRGHFVKRCCDKGIDTVGVDLSSSAVEHATSVLGVKAYCGRVETLAAELGQFDAVTFWATIEHVPDPVGTLRTLRTLLRPGGTLLLDTGVGHDLADRLMPGVNQWYDPPQHLWVFSVEGMRAALSAAGFSEVKLDPCYERNRARRFARYARNLATAALLRSVAFTARLRPPEFQFTRYPLGNLMLVRATQQGAHATRNLNNV